MSALNRRVSNLEEKLVELNKRDKPSLEALSDEEMEALFLREFDEVRPTADDIARWCLRWENTEPYRRWCEEEGVGQD